jgi:hypothetical protein
VSLLQGGEYTPSTSVIAGDQLVARFVDDLLWRTFAVAGVILASSQILAEAITQDLKRAKAGNVAPASTTRERAAG